MAGGYLVFPLRYPLQGGEEGKSLPVSLAYLDGDTLRFLLEERPLHGPAVAYSWEMVGADLPPEARTHPEAMLEAFRKEAELEEGARLLLAVSPEGGDAPEGGPPQPLSSGSGEMVAVGWRDPGARILLWADGVEVFRPEGGLVASFSWEEVGRALGALERMEAEGKTFEVLGVNTPAREGGIGKGADAPSAWDLEAE